MPRRAFRASGRSWRALNNEKPQKHYGFHHLGALGRNLRYLWQCNVQRDSASLSASRLHGRCGGCLEAIIGCLNDQKAPKIDTETLRERLGERSEPKEAPGEA